LAVTIMAMPLVQLTSRDSYKRRIQRILLLRVVKTLMQVLILILILILMRILMEMRRMEIAIWID
jgi:hypothetical protein